MSDYDSFDSCRCIKTHFIWIWRDARVERREVNADPRKIIQKFKPRGLSDLHTGSSQQIKTQKRKLYPDI